MQTGRIDPVSIAVHDDFERTKKGPHRCGPSKFAFVGLLTNQFERLGSMVRFYANNVGATGPSK
jgi:hypothetical protein